ncbi:citryl-CoA lyase [Cupriavidus agavae]|uniref:citrate synthase (unknown stereospecificity) n=1 Tax=Cupriavidus agavae TaxID=1001822 RepID=A0A4Q7RZ80_9BURK|nr:citryl-CoA lyase [Cupriavidus agavae]RZT39163.1 citrate synthase [Cupriavidus agavae]
MRIGRQASPHTAISTADAHSITIRGKDLCSELMGKYDFVDFYHFLLTGADATPAQSRLLNAALVAIAEHGLTPTVQAARMTYDADPAALQGAVAAGILGAGTVVMGTSELCGRFLHDIVSTQQATGEPLAAVVAEKLAQHKAARQTVPGYGHPLHGAGDPRTARLLELAAELEVRGPYLDALFAVEEAIPAVYGRKLPINASGSIPAVLLAAGFPLGALKGIPILARTAGLLAHLFEEASRPIGFLMAEHADQAIGYDGPPASAR